MTKQDQTPDGYLDDLPEDVRARIDRIYNVIRAAAEYAGAMPLEETLKWGEPAFVPPRKIGTTIRVAWPKKFPAFCGLYVHCQTDIIAQCREIFPDEFDYLDNRAVLIPVDQPFSDAELHQIATMALTYHASKRKTASA